MRSVYGLFSLHLSGARSGYDVDMNPPRKPSGWITLVSCLRSHLPGAKNHPHTFATSLANHHPCASQKLRYFLPPTYRRIGECAGLLNDISFNVNVARRTVIL